MKTINPYLTIKNRLITGALIGMLIALNS